jgi:RNA polymerase sigma-70 factor, ECF subfamily
MTEGKSRVEIFNQYRGRLFGIAYRMTGTRADAEDIVQEAYLRWHKTDAEKIESAEAWLVTITTRLSIDRLRVVSKERETYIGPWLPEPLSVREIYTPEEQLEFASSLSIAFLALLERLSPVERAAFLLRDVFDCSYQEIARIVGKTETACRQLIHRARERVRSEKPRFEATDADRERLIKKFVAAASAGDEATLLSLFAEDATLTSDGGGKVTAARKVIFGRRKIARLYAILGRKFNAVLDYRIERINGETGIVSTVFGQTFAATVFETEGEQIRRIYQVMNPDKLKGLFDDSIALT